MDTRIDINSLGGVLGILGRRSATVRKDPLRDVGIIYICEESVAVPVPSVKELDLFAS